MIPSHPKKDPPALDGDDSGVRTRLRRAQEELFQADDSAKQRPERKSSLKRENSYTLSAKNPNSGRLFRSKEMMLARKRGAHCGLCPPLEREEEEQLMTELVGPFPKRDGSMSLFVHLECLLWAPEVYTDGHGNFRMVYEVYNRGRKLVCATCGVKGATIGCYVESCRKSYHFACLKKGSCRLVEEHFVCFCPKHRGRADTAIFKQIISAASAAAKARTEVKVDTTYGLDTPHSFFTGLRRGQQEVIFSLLWGVTTIPNVENVEESLFSLKRRAVVKKSDRLRLRDGVRVLKHSVYNVASDQLALKVSFSSTLGGFHLGGIRIGHNCWQSLFKNALTEPNSHGASERIFARHSPRLFSAMLVAGKQSLSSLVSGTATASASDHGEKLSRLSTFRARRNTCD
mmetsp:Transcript_35949/g.143702  ORF Transcript_35949/g.143702 Transcript_35949/m.143702 type:complete len:401 (-) Transcript_35949:1517-2719(-)